MNGYGRCGMLVEGMRMVCSADEASRAIGEQIFVFVKQATPFRLHYSKVRKRARWSTSKRTLSTRPARPR
jgi:hypothetical protein